MIAAEIALGATLGFIAGLTGAGGAALALPGMIFLLGTTAVEAVATTFPFTAIMKVFGSLQHMRQGSVHRGVTLDLLAGSVPGTIVGIVVLSALVERFGEGFNDALKVAIGVLLLGSLVLSYLVRRRVLRRQENASPTGSHWPGILASAACGVVIGASSVGGGSLLIIVMLLLYRIVPAQIVGTSIVVSFVLMIIGTIGFWSGGFVDLTLAGHLAIGGVPGVLLGSVATLRASPRLLSQALSIAIAIAGVSLVVQGGLSFDGH